MVIEFPKRWKCDSQSVQPGGESAQVGGDRVQVKPVEVHQLQQGAPGQVGEDVGSPGTAQHLQFVQRGHVGEGVRVEKVDWVAPQLNLLQILQMGEDATRDGINGVVGKCTENNFVRNLCC